MSSPPSTYITTFQLSSSRGIENEKSQGVEQEPAALPTFDFPAPIPCQITPSFDDRGLNLFIARYITVVSSCFSRSTCLACIMR